VRNLTLHRALCWSDGRFIDGGTGLINNYSTGKSQGKEANRLSSSGFLPLPGGTA